MSCHLIPTWHKWNANANDVMMMWFTVVANLVTSHLACTMCTHVHGTHALNKYGASKYLSLDFEEFPALIKYYTTIGNITLLKEEYTTMENCTILKDTKKFMYLTQPSFLEDTPNQILHMLSTLQLWSNFLHYYWPISYPLLFLCHQT